MSIKQEFIHGSKYFFIAKIFNVFSNLLIGAILARLLTPSEFGTVAMIVVFMSFFSMLSEMGLGSGIVQDKKLINNELCTIFYITLLLGILTTILFFLFSKYFIVAFYKNLIYEKIGFILSISLFFYTINIVPNAMVRKAKKFKQIAITTIIVSLITSTIAIILAYKGAGVYALIYRNLLSSILTFAIYYYYSHLKLTFNFQISGFKRIFSYSSYQFLFSFVNYFSRNLDNLLVGKVLGNNMLGYYDKAYSLSTYPLNNLTSVISPVIHPILSDYQSDLKRIEQVHLKLIKGLFMIGALISLICFFNAREIILIMYGKQWEYAIPVFRALSLSMGIQMILSTSGFIFQATGDTRLLFYSGLLSSIIMVTAIIFGLFVGGSIVYMSWCLLIAFSLNLIQTFYFLYNKALKSSFLVAFKVLYKIFFVSFLCFLFMLFFKIQINSLLLSFIVNSTVLVSMYIIGLKVFKEISFLHELLTGLFIKKQ